MTRNQIAYHTMKENQRANRVNEIENRRHNVAGEKETARHNVATEAETNRHNVRTEDLSFDTLAETTRHNTATETETSRHNKHQEIIGYVNAAAKVGDTVAKFVPTTSITSETSKDKNSKKSVTTTKKGK